MAKDSRKPLSCEGRAPSGALLGALWGRLPPLLRQVTKTFGDPPVPVLQDISLSIEDGQFVALTGRSGSGKSTLLYILSTLDRPSSGEIALWGARTSPDLPRLSCTGTATSRRDSCSSSTTCCRS